MENKKVKLAVFRENSIHACPFGLSVPDGCFYAGGLVGNMTPLASADELVQYTKEQREAMKENIAKANMRVFMFSKTDKDNIKYCPYANKVLGNHKVDCNYGDNNAGIGSANLDPTAPMNTYLNVGYYSMPAYSLPYNLDVGGGAGELLNKYFSDSDEDKIKKPNK